MADSGIGSAQIRVSTEALITQAEEVRRLGSDMRQRYQALADTMERTRHYWLGDGGDTHRQLYEKQKENVDKMLRRLMEHPDDLIAIARNYSEGERVNVTTAQQLDVDIIQ